MLKLLIRTIGIPFYQQHIGLFLVAFYLFFGMIQGYDLILFHKALLISICSSSLNLLILFAVWFLYALKCLLFVRQKLSQEDYTFTKVLTANSSKLQINLWIKIFAFLLLPVLAYTSLMIITSIVHHYWFSLLAAILVSTSIVILLAFYTYRLNNFSFNVSKLWLKFPHFQIHKQFWAWPIWYLLSEQRIMLLMTKLTSFLFFNAILWVFADLPNELKVKLTACLTVVLCHAMLMPILLKFDAHYQAFAKGLPIAQIRRFAYWIFIFGLLLIPEFILMVSSTGMTALQLMICVCFGMASVLGLQALAYLVKANSDKYILLLLFFFLGSMFAILGGYHLPYSLAIILLSALTFCWKYKQLDLKEIA